MIFVTGCVLGLLFGVEDNWRKRFMILAWQPRNRHGTLTRPVVVESPPANQISVVVDRRSGEIDLSIIVGLRLEFKEILDDLDIDRVYWHGLAFALNIQECCRLNNLRENSKKLLSTVRALSLYP